jgi:hypothetical protein
MNADRLGLEFSIMNYPTFIGDPPLNGATNSSSPLTFMMYDIRALQQLYGADFGLAGQNVTYKWSATTGRQSISINGGSFVDQTAPFDGVIFTTVWTAGANSTYDLSNFTGNQVDDMNPGRWMLFSNGQRADLDFFGTPGTQLARANVYNSLLFNNDQRSLIRNIITGIGDDTITSNAANNIIDAGRGSDTVNNAGTRAASDIFHAANGDIHIVNAADGDDTYRRVEFVQFTDQRVFLDDYSQDTVTTGLVALALGGGINSGSTTGILEFRNDHDWFKLNTTAGVNYVVQVFGSTNAPGFTSATPSLAIHDGAGAAFTSLNLGDAVNLGVDPQREFTATGGAFYIDAASTNAAATGTYRVNVIVDDYLATTATTGILTVGGSSNGNLEYRGDHDYFKSTLIGGTVYAIQEIGHDGIAAKTLADPFVHVRNAAGNQVIVAGNPVQNDDANAGTHDSFVLFTPGAGGTFFVDAGAHNFAGTGTYAVKLDIASTLTKRDDFNGDFTSDILFRSDAGEVSTWLVTNNTAPGANRHTYTESPDLSWHIAETGDFNGDLKADILFRNDDGGVMTWDMNGNAIASQHTLATQGLDWHIRGTGDFDADGRADIVWHLDDGTVHIWEMNDATVKLDKSLGASGLDEHIVGTGRFFSGANAANADILWRSDSGEVRLWKFDNALNVTRSSLGIFSLDQHVIGTGDSNGDGTADVQWRSDSGEVMVSQIVNGLITATFNLGVFGLDQHAVDFGDYNKDGKSDILWQADDGTLTIWDIDTTQAVGSQVTQIAPSVALVGLDQHINHHGYEYV